MYFWSQFTPSRCAAKFRSGTVITCMHMRPPGRSASSHLRKNVSKYSDADGLEHLDGDDAVELAGDLAVVLEPDVNAVFQARLPNALLGQRHLLFLKC